MALKRDARYPGRFIAANTAHPQGAFKNRSTPTSQDGSYLEADWMNDIDGFFARILNVAGVAPNGTVDDGSNSQLYNSLLTAMPGRLINVRYFTNNTTYVPTTGTKKIFVRGIGTGGNGGGSLGTNNSSCTACGGGGSGGYAEAWYDNGFSNVPIVIGARGTKNYGQGASGSGSGFGALMTLGGGGGGSATASPASTTYLENGGGVGGTASISGQVAGITVPGNNGFGGKIFSGSATSGMGASSQLGYGGGVGSSSSGSAVGVLAGGYGAGGGGATIPINSTQQYGGDGSQGIFIVWEFA